MVGSIAGRSVWDIVSFDVLRQHLEFVGTARRVFLQEFWVVFTVILASSGSWAWRKSLSAVWRILLIVSGWRWAVRDVSGVSPLGSVSGDRVFAVSLVFSVFVVDGLSWSLDWHWRDGSRAVWDRQLSLVVSWSVSSRTMWDNLSWAWWDLILHKDRWLKDKLLWHLLLLLWWLLSWSRRLSPSDHSDGVDWFLGDVSDWYLSIVESFEMVESSRNEWDALSRKDPSSFNVKRLQTVWTTSLDVGVHVEVLDIIGVETEVRHEQVWNGGWRSHFQRNEK